MACGHLMACGDLMALFGATACGDNLACGIDPTRCHPRRTHGPLRAIMAHGTSLMPCGDPRRPSGLRRSSGMASDDRTELRRTRGSATIRELLLQAEV